MLRRAGLALLLGSYLVLGLLYSLFVPIGETPDEIGHFEFARYVGLHRALPVQEMRPNNEVGEGHQTPLYYILAALPMSLVDSSDVVTFRINPDLSFAVDGAKNKHAMLHTEGEAWPYTGFVLAWRIGRLMSLLCGLVGVYLAYRLGLLAFRGSEPLALLTGCLFALNPQYLFLSGAVSNDSLGVLLGTALLLVASVWLLGGRLTGRWAVFAGLLGGLALLTKLTLAIPVALSGLVLLDRARDAGGEGKSARYRIELPILMGLVGLVVSGPYFVRNYLLYGDVFALNVDRAQNPTLTQAASIDIGLVRGLVLTARDSYFARFGWMNVAPPLWVYDLITLGLVVAALGLLLLLVRRWRARWEASPAQGEPWLRIVGLGLAFTLALFLAQLIFSQTKGPSAYQGRYLFPASAGIAVALVAGLKAFMRPRLLASTLALAYFLGVGFALYCLFGVIVPRYPEPLPIYPPSKSVAPQSTLSAQLGAEYRLLGYELDEADWKNGKKVKIDLYFEALASEEKRYTAFVQLIDASGKLVAQNDQPLLAEAPSHLRLMTGEKVRQRYTLDLSAVPAGAYTLHVGMYDPATVARLPVTLPDGKIADHVELVRSVGP